MTFVRTHHSLQNMKKTELLLGIITTIAIILRFMEIPYAGFLMTISLTTLAFFYFAFGLILFINEINFKDVFKKETFKHISKLRILGTFATGFSISLIIIGMLFKLGGYSPTNIVLVFGLILALIIMSISTIKFLKAKTDFYRQILSRIILVGGVGLIMLSLPV